MSDVTSAAAGLAAVAGQLAAGAIEVVDLTSPLHAGTPVLRLPERFGQTARFALEEISRFDDRGPGWYWNNFRTGEHTGTHFDAPNHWITGKDLDDVSRVPAQRLAGPAAVVDRTAQTEADPSYLLDVPDLLAWQEEHGALPENGWLLYRTGWSRYADDPEAFANAGERGPRTPGLTPAAARYLAEETGILGLGVETVGTDAGHAAELEPPYPCHSLLLGAGKYGLTQLRRLDRLPATGAVVIAAPLPIVGGSGSPCRVLALVPAGAR
ncbi:cyclase family protein [Streptomyces chilikensis]|uniref:Cyclase family protein n=1 Tax=Streptomyces chilikensis TaxID=1194079 RepID=A0ABV3EMX7_9ACTN